MKIISNLKDDVAGILSGIDLNNVSNLYGAFERAATTVIQKAGVPEASGIQKLNVYSGVYDYPCDENIFGSAITDLVPQGITRNLSDIVSKKYPEEFDRMKLLRNSSPIVTFVHKSGVPVIRIAQNYTIPKITIDPMTDITGWTASAGASNLIADNSVYYQRPASLRFNLANTFGVSATGILEKTLTSSIDLSTYKNVGNVFLAANFPDTSVITNVELRIGNDGSNYYSVTQTTGFIGSMPENEFGLIQFDLSAATETGTVDMTKIDYVDIIITYNGATQTNVRLGDLFIALPLPVQMTYRTTAIFKNSAGAISMTITDDNDIILLNAAAYNIFQHEAALATLLQSGGTLASPMATMLKAVLHGQGNDIGLYAHYRADNPSQEIRTVGSYYDIDNNYNQYWK
jgi:hypothetical protein